MGDWGRGGPHGTQNLNIRRLWKIAASPASCGVIVLSQIILFFFQIITRGDVTLRKTSLKDPCPTRGLRELTQLSQPLLPSTQAGAQQTLPGL